MIITSENYNEFDIGTKAKNLFFMRKSGINVPPLFCISGKDIYHAQEAAAKILGTGKAVSVRSSSSLEDGNSISFAGQFCTFLNVSYSEITAVAEKVATVPHSDSFLEYCNINSINPSKISITVIIQDMVEAELSGVIFTANPQGILNEAVVIVGRGTGENIVEDKTDTTAYYYNTTDDLYYSEQYGNSPLISDSLLQSLIENAKRIKELFGNECDIEFAIKDGEIWILQARPITTITQSDFPIILDNSNIVESYPGITFPLTQSFIKEAYYSVFRSLLLRLTHEPKTVARIDSILHNMVDTANGRVYYRISNWYDVILFLPFNKKIIPLWQEMLGVKNKNITSHLSKKIGFVTHTKVTFSFIKMLIVCPKLMEELDSYFNEIVNTFKSVDLDKATNSEILAHYQNVKQKVTEKWDLTLVNDMYSFIFTGLLKTHLKAKKVPNYKAAANRLISGLNNIESMKPVNALIELANLSTDRKELTRLKKIHTLSDYRTFAASNSITAQKIKEYIELYGDRNVDELKLESKTFRTNPELLVQKIVQYAENETSISSVVDSEFPKGICGFFAKRAALGIKNREKSRLNRSRLYGMMRSMMLKIGKNLTETGQIDKVDDVFMLTYNEIEHIASNGENMQKLISQRRSKYKRFAQLPAYTRLVFAEKVFDKSPKNIGEMKKNSDSCYFEGIPCSEGKVQGEVLLIEKISTEIDTANKIIVTKMTDPGWVFLIAGAAGIIAEKGSLLSHTAIISRELRKPAVVGVENITQMLKSGDIVEMDGGTGEIIVIHRKD